MQAENKKYNEAITALEEASALNIESKKEEISRLKDEFNKQKEENKWFNKWKRSSARFLKICLKTRRIKEIRLFTT